MSMPSHLLFLIHEPKYLLCVLFFLNGSFFPLSRIMATSLVYPQTAQHSIDVK